MVCLLVFPIAAFAATSSEPAAADVDVVHRPGLPVVWWIAPIGAMVALYFAYRFYQEVKGSNEGDPEMIEISGYVREGAMAYLKRQYKVVTVVFILLALTLAYMAFGLKVQNTIVPVAFLTGGFFSGLCGYLGMRTATMASHRTAAGARESLNRGLVVAFRAGAVMGLIVVGFALLDITGWFLILYNVTELHLSTITVIMLTFGMGASTQALFARVGGGIYTKAADVGADLVGKIEAGIPEDDPRNPATIADNVGDNVGDVAGMGADLFESYIGAIVAAMVLGATITVNGVKDIAFVLLPLVLAGAGILFSGIAATFVRTREGGNPQAALNRGTFGACIIMAVATYFICKKLLPGEFNIDSAVAGADALKCTSAGVFLATVVGLAAGAIIGLLAEYYTAEGKGPSNGVAEASQTGAATNIIAGLGVGMISTAYPVLVLAAATIACYYLAGLYGIALGGLGMLATTGIQLAVDAYGPIADNAGGIAEMAGLPKEVRQRTDKLDAVGNTTAAIGKGFAIGSAALTALALFAAFREIVDLKIIDVTDPKVMAGLLVGSMMPFLFSAFAMKAVGKAAYAMVEEVRRQFKSIPGLLEGKAGVKADYARCVDISTAAAIKKMTVPALLGILTPIVIGFVFGKEMLGGLLAGVTASGVLMALFMSNAGGCWDNAKKHIEGGALGGKGSAPHKAAVVGDTVGDPFKDTAGPVSYTHLTLPTIYSV